MYRYNWFHCDDFSGLNIDEAKSLPVPADNCVSGIDVGPGRVWSIIELLLQLPSIITLSSSAGRLWSLHPLQFRF